MKYGALEVIMYVVEVYTISMNSRSVCQETDIRIPNEMCFSWHWSPTTTQLDIVTKLVMSRNILDIDLNKNSPLVVFGDCFNELGVAYR